MKLNHQQIQEQNLNVYIEEPNSKKPRLVFCPELVDTDTGTVQMWIIPFAGAENLLHKEELDFSKKPPEEVSSLAGLRTVTGKITIVNKEGSVIFKSI
jgi:hypothetical protein